MVLASYTGITCMVSEFFFIVVCFLSPLVLFIHKKNISVFSLSRSSGLFGFVLFFFLNHTVTLSYFGFVLWFLGFHQPGPDSFTGYFQVLSWWRHQFSVWLSVSACQDQTLVYYSLQSKLCIQI